MWGLARDGSRQCRGEHMQIVSDLRHMQHDSNDEFPVPQADCASANAGASPAREGSSSPLGEIGGPKGPEPTRFGDWEHKGRCIDF